MKRALLVTITSFVFLMQGFSQENYLDTIWSGGIMRTFRVYVPAIYNGQTARPLVFNFHGLGGNALNWESTTKFEEVADTANFILVTANGTINPQYGQFWNNFPFGSNVDDVLFVANLIDTLAGLFNVDTNSVYSAGWSNGGFMGYDLACKLASRIAAIASVCGSMEVDRLMSCNPSRAVPILEIHGTQDPVVSYFGGTVFGVNYTAVDSVQKFWTTHNQCLAAPAVFDLPNTNTADGSTIEKYIYSDCYGGVSMELYKVQSGGHTWPGLAGANTNRDIIAEQEIWRFFSQHKLSDGISATTEKPRPLQVTISPNPSSGFLNVTFPDHQATPSPDALTVLDLQGKVLLQKALMPGEIAQQIPLNLSGIPAGIYYLIVETKGHDRMFRRFVVIR